jgi:DNA-binding NtrC family response regulator
MLIDVFCKDEEYSLIFATDGGEALDIIQQGGINLVVTDVRMPKMGGDILLKRIRDGHPDLPVIIMTSYGSIEDAVSYLKMGARDYITKPLTKEGFCHRINLVIENLRMSRQIDRLQHSLKRITDRDTVVGLAPAIRKVMDKLPSIARTDASVVIYGESGTGKELVAREIHFLSPRASGPFVAVNCGALPENLLESELFGYKRGAFTDAYTDKTGLVEEANRGTLFLDEIGDIPPQVQVKLLRFLQQKEIKPLGSNKVIRADVRIIAATNRDLKAAMEEGRFRDDLYYRLNIVPITLPPLRERREDIPRLANFFLKKFAQEFQKDVREFSPAALQALTQYDWPGNIRELENKIQQVVVVGSGEVVEIGDLDLPGHDPGLPSVVSAAAVPEAAEAAGPAEAMTFKEEKRRVVDAFERRYLLRALRENGGNISRAARYAGMDRKNFWQLMRKHSLQAREAAPAD